MSLGLTSIMYGSLCFPSFYVTWSHFRSVWVSMLSEFLCHLVSLPLCMVLYVFQVSMSFVLISVLWVSMFSEFLWHLISLRSVWVSILSDFLCHLISLPFCMYFYVVRVSKSLGFTFVLYVLLCCPSFCHLVSRPLCMVFYVVRVSVLVLFYLYVRHCVNYYGRSFLFSSPCQRQCKLLPSLRVRRQLTFHILIFSSETSRPNEVKRRR